MAEVEEFAIFTTGVEGFDAGVEVLEVDVFDDADVLETVVLTTGAEAFTADVLA